MRAAAEHILSRVDEAGTRLENINSSRLQLKLGRTLDAFPPPLRRVVEVLERRVAAACGLRRAELRVQDCYALLTPESEVVLLTHAHRALHTHTHTHTHTNSLTTRTRTRTLNAGPAPASLRRGVASAAWPLPHRRVCVWRSVPDPP